MAVDWQSLVANLAIVALFISTWVNGQFIFAGRPRAWRNFAFGAAMGLGAVASMSLSIQLQPGVLFDLRSSLVAIAAFFGGPIAAAVAAVFAITYRLILGGAGASAGAMGIATAAIAGFVVSWLARGRLPGLASAALLAVAVAGVSLGVSLLLSVTILGNLLQMAVPVALMNGVATLVSAFFIMRYEAVEKERDLLREAFLQSPDYQYVKTPDCRFAAANIAVARHNGFDTPAGLIDKTDFDIADTERARELMAAEREIVRTGQGFADREEMLTDVRGRETWFSTSKVPLYNREGEIIGIAGATRDITSRKRLEREAVESRNQLRYVLAEMSDGIAMFDRAGVLIYCNERYREFFELTSDMRRPGRHIRDILKAVAATGEQKGIPPGQEEKWVEDVAATLDGSGEQEVQLHDGRWVLVRTRPTTDGAALVVVSDVTKIKQAETKLLSMTEQLKLLATTDGLTGLINRRAFDTALETEVARSRRSQQPLSLLLIDVDRFKAYNDLYGHQAGDDVLRTIGACLKDSMRRPGDIAARYGGEEFVSILPNTDEDGAFFIADAFRESLHALALPHEGSDKRILTASVGLATFVERDEGMNATELVRRADEALYNAKGAGRDRVTGWRAKHEVLSRGARA